MRCKLKHHGALKVEYKVRKSHCEDLRNFPGAMLLLRDRASKALWEAIESVLFSSILFFVL